LNNIQELIQSGEGLRIEFKLNFSDAVIETLVAFANTEGGSVILGVDDSGKYKGINIGKESIQKWLNDIKLKTQPSIIPFVEEYKTTKGMVNIVFSVNEFPIKPISFRGRYFKRVNNSNHQLNLNEITDLNLQSLQLSWDAYIHPEKSVEDLDIEKIKKFISKVNETGRFQLGEDWKLNLEKLRLVKGNTISHAALLLFGKESTQYNIHLGRFKTPSLILDDRMFKYTLFEAVEESMKYIISQLKVAFEITGKTTQRTEIFEYPLTAIREILLNTIIHRDYLSPIDIQIKIFDSKITFFNPGKLFGNLSIEALQKDNYQAYARNKLIAEAFYLTGDIEKYGSGFIRIRKEIQEYPSMTFNFEEVANGFLTVVEYIQQKTDSSSESVVENVVESVVENVVERRHEKILNIISTNKQISAIQIAEILSMSERTVQRDIENLKNSKKIKRRGSAKGGYWDVLAKK